MARSSYRLGRRLRGSRRGVLDFLTYLATIPGAVAGGSPLPRPGAFEAADWSVDPNGSDSLTVTVTAVPPNVVISDIEYRLYSGEWVSSGINSPGTFDITGLLAATIYDVYLRAVNSGGASDPSDMKQAETAA